MSMIGSSSLVRGGQVTLHGWRMTGQVIRSTLFVSFMIGSLAAAIFLYQNTSGRQWYAAWLHILCETKLGMGVEADKAFIYTIDGLEVTTTLGIFSHNRKIMAARAYIVKKGIEGAWLGAGWGAGVITLSLVIYIINGVRVSRNRRRRLRGAQLIKVTRLNRIIAWRNFQRRLSDLVLFRKPLSSAYQVAGVKWPLGKENLHTLITGTTGTGKTVAISDLVEQIRMRGGKAVIYDYMGHYLSHFYDPARDVILNPLDARSALWSPLHEGHSVVDFDTMGKALLPRTRDLADPFWLDAARVVFSRGTAALAKSGENTNAALHALLLKANMHELFQFMKGTEVQSILDEKSEKVALSVRSVMTTHLSCLGLLPDQGNRFSIREWMKDEQQSGILFLMSRADIHESLRGLLSCWLETALTALLSLPQSHHRRIWFIMDELASLHQIPSLVSGLAQSRQFGGCFILGVQAVSNLRDIYGTNGTQSISSLCGTRLILSAPDEDTAQWGASSLGRIEEESYRENYSYGEHRMRDSISYNQDRQLRPLVYPSDIMNLPDLEGYLKMPRDLPAARIKMIVKQWPKIAEHFIAREETPKEDTPQEEAPESKPESRENPPPPPASEPAKTAPHEETRESKPKPEAREADKSKIIRFPKKIRKSAAKRSQKQKKLPEPCLPLPIPPASSTDKKPSSPREANPIFDPGDI